MNFPAFRNIDGTENNMTDFRERPFHAISDEESHKQLQIRPLRFLAIAGLVLALFTTFGPLTAAAQESTPAASPTGTEPSACRVAPRPSEDLVALAEATPGVLQSQMQGEAFATPVIPTGGVPADPAVVSEVTATLTEAIACTNAGDIARYMALLTDDAVFRAFGGGGIPEGDDLAQEIAALATPHPLPNDQRIGAPTVRDVRLLPNGRVTALVRADGPDSESLTLFVKSDVRYLIDWFYPAPAGATPTP